MSVKASLLGLLALGVSGGLLIDGDASVNDGPLGEGSDLRRLGGFMGVIFHRDNRQNASSKVMSMMVLGQTRRVCCY